MKSKQSFRLDRSAFRAQTAREAADHASYYCSLHWTERLEIVAYLNSVAFRYDLNHPPKMDRTAFRARSRNSNG